MLYKYIFFKILYYLLIDETMKELENTLKKTTV